MDSFVVEDWDRLLALFPAGSPRDAARDGVRTSVPELAQAIGTSVHRCRVLVNEAVESKLVRIMTASGDTVLDRDHPAKTELSKNDRALAGSGIRG
jgi:hypothetical protein